MLSVQQRRLSQLGLETNYSALLDLVHDRSHQPLLLHRQTERQTTQCQTDMHRHTDTHTNRHTQTILKAAPVCCIMSVGLVA